jgi:hypothetical protein
MSDKFVCLVWLMGFVESQQSINDVNASLESPDMLNGDPL